MVVAKSFIMYSLKTDPSAYLKLIYTEQKKKRNNRPPRIFEFKGKMLIISGLLLYDSHSWDIRVDHAKTDFHFDKN